MEFVFETVKKRSREEEKMLVEHCRVSTNHRQFSATLVIFIPGHYSIDTEY